jgi:hypothetical protein
MTRGDGGRGTLEERRMIDRRPFSCETDDRLLSLSRCYGEIARAAGRRGVRLVHRRSRWE